MVSSGKVVSSAGHVTWADVERLANAVRELAPCHRDPERFHMDKAEIAGELRALARRLREAPGCAGPSRVPPYTGSKCAEDR